MKQENSKKILVFGLIIVSFLLIFLFLFRKEPFQPTEHKPKISPTAGLLTVFSDRFSDLQKAQDYDGIMRELVYTEGVDENSKASFLTYLRNTYSSGSFRYQVDPLPISPTFKEWQEKNLTPKGIGMSLPPTHKLRSFFTPEDGTGERPIDSIFVGLNGRKVLFSISKVVDEAPLKFDSKEFLKKKEEGVAAKNFCNPGGDSSVSAVEALLAAGQPPASDRGAD